jgi:hypothetical protein
LFSGFKDFARYFEKIVVLPKQPTLGVTAMRTLEQLLEEQIQKLGPDHPAVQMLRNQIAADNSGKSFRELYTGHIDSPPLSAAKGDGLTPLPMDDRRPGGLLVTDEEMLSLFGDVIEGLMSKIEVSVYQASLAELISYIDQSDIYDHGDHVGVGLPLHYLRTYLCDEGMAEMLELEEEQVRRMSEAEKAKFARERLESLVADSDADVCPGYWLMRITDGKDSFCLGYSVVGYSFSGIEWSFEGAFLSEEDYIAEVCCGSGTYFNGCFCPKGTPTPSDQISDAALLKIVWGP